MKQFKNITRIVRHFILRKTSLTNIRDHFSLVKTLKPFKEAGFITNRTFMIYLFSYIAPFLSTKEKLDVLDYNYNFLKNIFSKDKLKQIFNEGIICFEEINEEDTYKVLLKSSHIFEFEGSQFLVFAMNDIVLFTLSFTFAPGNIFGIESENIIYVSSLKGTKNEFEKFSKATKYFKENIPSVILLKVLEAIAQNLNIGTLAGISAENQLSYAPGFNDQNFISNYDEFWKNLGAVETKNNNYYMPLPLAYKDLSLIKQKYRNRTIKKRKVLDGILALSLDMFGKAIAVQLKASSDPATVAPIYTVQTAKQNIAANTLTIIDKRLIAHNNLVVQMKSHDYNALTKQELL